MAVDIDDFDTEVDIIYNDKLEEVEIFKNIETICFGVKFGERQYITMKCFIEVILL